MWNTVHAATRVTSLAAKQSASRSGLSSITDVWRISWEEVVKARHRRKEYLWKSDYDLMGVMGRGMGPVIMLATIILILYETHAWFTVALPYWVSNPRCYIFFAGVSAIVPGRVFLDYFRTSFTDPGRPQSVSPLGVTATSQGQGVGDVELGGPDSSSVKRCHKCFGPKPSRCHHCKVCRRCVLKMDHHCPFVNNCVGLRNHRFFILFLVELVFGCCVIVASLVPQLLTSLRSSAHQTLANRIHVITTFAVALISGSALAPFFYFHMQLVVVNETTLENMKSRSEHMKHSMKQKQLERSLERAKKALLSADTVQDGHCAGCAPEQIGQAKEGLQDKVDQILEEQRAEQSKHVSMLQARAEDKRRNSRETFLDNFIEVFGAPPAQLQKRVEAILEWFNPTPTPPVKKRSA